MTAPPYFAHNMNLRGSTNAQVMIAGEPNGLQLYGLLMVLIEMLGVSGGSLPLSEMGIRNIALNAGINKDDLPELFNTLAFYGLITKTQEALSSALYDEFVASYNEAKERRSNAGRENVAKRYKKDTPKAVDVDPSK